MNSEALTEEGRGAAGLREAAGRGQRPPDLRFRVTPRGRSETAAPSPEEEEVEAEEDRRLLVTPAMSVGRAAEVEVEGGRGGIGGGGGGGGGEDAAAAEAARVGGRAPWSFIGGRTGGDAETGARRAKWRASSEAGAGGQEEPTPVGARPRRGQPRGRKVARDGWEARAGCSCHLSSPRIGIPCGRRAEWLSLSLSLSLSSRLFPFRVLNPVDRVAAAAACVGGCARAGCLLPLALGLIWAPCAWWFRFTAARARSGDSLVGCCGEA